MRPILSIALIIASLTAASQAAYVATFDDIPYAPGANYENGAHLAGGSFTSGGVQFANSYFPSYDGWAGFAYSRVADTTTAGYLNQYAAIPGTGAAASPSYAVGYIDSFNNILPTATLPSFSTGLTGVYVTNATYAYLAIVNGDDGFGGVRQFGTTPPGTVAGNQGYPDLFNLTITGADTDGNSTGSVSRPLADYTDASNAADYALNAWTYVDLTSLAPTTHTLTFSLTSTDSSAFGMNTPSYLAIDSLSFVPEPSTALLLAALPLIARRRK